MKRVAYTSNFVGMTNPPAVALANKLAGYAHSQLNTTFFTSGGSESTDTAFKTARYYWKRVGKPDKVKFISRRNAYHGITMAATSATGIDRYHRMFGPLMPEILHIPAPNPYRYEGDIQAGETVGQAAARALEEAILREGPETIAAFIAEPVQGAGGVIVPPDDYFPLTTRICEKYDVLLIADEVITGFGRTGGMFATRGWDVQPDILSFAKGITSGYKPLGGIQISDEIHDTIMSAPEDEAWMHGYTYSGHATACAVGRKNIEIIERDGLAENAQKMGKRLLDGLETLKEFPQVDNVRGRGLLCGIEIVKNRETREPDGATAGQVARACQEKGLRTRVLDNTLAFSPPLIITAEEVDQIVEILGNVLDTM
jgi:adenosylmethionine-8-amino-7-oxononanoate aminotransferase